MKLKRNIAISDTGYLFNPSTGESFAVNPIGLEVLSLMKQDLLYEEISGRILDKYETDRATFEKDFADFMSMLKLNLLIDDDEEA
jgi:hypothetical protein